VRVQHSWIVLGVSTAAQASQSGAWAGLAVMGPALRDSYDLSLFQVGVVFAAPSVGLMLTLLPWGFLADRFGERRTAAVGLTGSAGGLLGASYAPDFGSLIVCLWLAGVFGAATNSATGRAVMRWFGHEKRGFALGIRHMAVPIGGFTSAVGIPLLLHVWGLRGALLGLAVVVLGAALATSAAFRPMAAPMFEPTSGENLRRPLQDRSIWRLSLGSSILGCAQVAVLGFVVLFLETARHFSDRRAAGVLAAIYVAGACGSLAAGRLSDRLGLRIGLIRRVALANAFAIGALAALIGATPWLLVPALIISGALTMSWNGLSFAAAVEMAGLARSGVAIGLQQTVSAIAVSLTPLLFAPLVDSVSWQVAYGVAAVFPLAALVVLKRLQSRELLERRKTESQQVTTVPPSHLGINPASLADSPGKGELETSEGEKVADLLINENGTAPS
jgi:MFS family permease